VLIKQKIRPNIETLKGFNIGTNFSAVPPKLSKV